MTTLRWLILVFLLGANVVGLCNLARKLDLIADSTGTAVVVLPDGCSQGTNL